jgi:hypothetical protein
MTRPAFLLPAALLFWVAPFTAQATLSARDVTVQVSPSQPGASPGWTDSGLDLQPGAVLEISATAAGIGTSSAACDPKGAPAADSTAVLPLPSAPAGALLARLHAQGATPLLVGSGTELKIEEVSHLYFMMNFSGAATCQGDLAVKIHIATGASTNGASTTEAADAQISRKQQLKSQLATAAQVFLSGQFGLGKSEAETSDAASASGTAAAVPLAVSIVPLDGDLRKDIDKLPRRVNDQFQNLGDMVNFVIIGNQKDVQSALEAATWHVADASNSSAVINAVNETYGSKDYLAMPMSTLFLFGRRQDFGYEMAEPIAMVASRHHFRIWKTAFSWKGQEVWCGAGTHDIGFARDKRNGSVTHKIDPAVDGERDNVGSSLQKANKVKELTYYLPKDAVQDARNATGDGYHSDGRILIIFLK